jgi:Carboxypeptidase regulatory-like domain
VKALETTVQTRTRAPFLRAAAAALALALAFAPRAHAIGEITGRIAGYVFDPTGAALSEVPLTLTGSQLAVAIERSTGDEGKFEFDNLPVGDDYVLEVNVPGFQPVRLAAVNVRLGQTTPADIHLQIQAEGQASQTFTIIEKVNPVINPDSAQSVAVIDAEKAAQTPIFHQVEGMAQQVAGVGPGTRPATRGGLSRHGRFFVDGLDTTDITDGSITAPMNFDAVQNFEIIVGGMDAQYNSMGMITNAVTKSGTNEWKYDVNFTLQPTPLAAKNQYPANQPPIYSLYVDPSLPGPQTSFYSPVVNLGGPIIKDKLWFYASYQQNFSKRENALSVLGTQENRPTNTTTTLGRIKLTWQATSSDKVHFAVNLDRNTIENNNGSSFVTDAGESKIDRGGEFVLVNWDHNLSETTLFQLQTGLTYKKVNTDPQSGDYTSVSHRDLATSVTDFNAGSISAAEQGNYIHETKWRLQFDPTLSWKWKGLGTHQLKAGVQTAYLIDQKATGVSGNARYTDRNGVCNEKDPATYAYCYQRTDYYGDNNLAGSLSTKATALNLGAFIQDRWNVNRQLTIIPGFRVDLGKMYGTDGSLITNLAGVGPRLSVTYDLFGDRKTLVSGHAGRNNDIGNMYIAQHANPSLAGVTSSFSSSAGAFPACSLTNLGTGCSLSGGASGRLFYTHDTALLSKVAPSPHVDEVSVGIKHEIADETVLGLDYTYRYYGNMWADQEVNRIWDATGTKILGYVNGVPQTVYVSRAFDSAYRNYHGLDLWVQGTPGRWDLLASYTLSFNKGTVSDYFDTYLQNPRMTQFYDGYTSDDRRHTLKGSISYKTPFGLDLGMRLQYRTGGADWQSFSGANGERIYRSPRGTGFPLDSGTGQPNFNDPNSWAELRDPAQFQLDLQARYNFQNVLRLKQRAELVLLVVNALNSSQATNYIDSYSTRLNRVGFANSYLSPLQAEFILRVRN